MPAERHLADLWSVGANDKFVPIKSMLVGRVWVHMYEIRKNKYVRFTYGKNGVVSSKEVFRGGVLVEDLVCVIGAAMYFKLRTGGRVYRLKRKRDLLSGAAIWDALQGALESGDITREKLKAQRKIRKNRALAAQRLRATLAKKKEERAKKKLEVSNVEVGSEVGEP